MAWNTTLDVSFISAGIRARRGRLGVIFGVGQMGACLSRKLLREGLTSGWMGSDLGIITKAGKGKSGTCFSEKCILDSLDTMLYSLFYAISFLHSSLLMWHSRNQVVFEYDSFIIIAIVQYTCVGKI
jgi:hypothetical protein